MTSTTATVSTAIDQGPLGEDPWRDAGAAWGHAAQDWAYLFEPYSRDAADHIFDRVSLGEGTELLDIACGSGYATARAARRGARVSGLDASTELVAIARRRSPEGDFQINTMFELGYAEASFDVVTSFNGIWGGCDAAIAEAFRILRPGGHVAITFWGPGPTLGYRDMFVALGNATSDVKDEMIGLASIGTPGVAESMFADAGFGVIERGRTQAVHEFPDAEIAWRCLRSPGLMVPALKQLGDDGLRALLMPTIEPFCHDDGSYRIVNELTHVIGHKPATSTST